MSRIGKLPITVPDTVNINYTSSQITVEGKFGVLHNQIPEAISIIEEENQLSLSLKDNKKSNRALYGLYRTLINNMVIGVSQQFDVTLILKGVGYRASVQGKQIILNLGYSHTVNIDIPSDISVEVVQNTTISLKSCNKELLTQFAADIRSWRLPEPYKGKGILYKGEQIIRKAGKSGK